jgi:hypothetical protein
MKHTNEPWEVEDQTMGIFSKNEFIGELCDCVGLFNAKDRANSARIVECVNACEGIDNPMEAIKELVEACEGLMNDDTTLVGSLLAVQDALQKVKGE